MLFGVTCILSHVTVGRTGSLKWLWVGVRSGPE